MVNCSKCMAFEICDNISVDCEMTRKFVNDVYERAIEDFKIKMKDFVEKTGTIPNHYNIDLLAEQLKDGV